MDYERIHRPSSQGGGLSPAKLRAMLLGGTEKRKKQEDEIESRFYFRSNSGSEIDSRRGSTSDDCRDVDMVSSHTSSSSRVRSQDEESLPPEIVPPGFEFQKAGRGGGVQRPPLVSPFLKPAPSKWDDAQKWIASPGVNKNAAAVGKKASCWIPAAEVVLEVMEEGETKRVDAGQGKKETGGKRDVDLVEKNSFNAMDSCSKPCAPVENPISESGIVLCRHDSSASVQSATAFFDPPSTARSVCMRDMGTEMTPIASQEPSRTGTPIRSTTPTRSPTSSQPSSPPRTVPNANHVRSVDCSGEMDAKELSEKELQIRTRKEIMALGTQLGKKNIAAWASKQEENDGSASFTNLVSGRASETRAAAWEEAEKAKYLARFKREEIKIQAWEDHEKAKIEAEMRKIEVKVERTRADAHERLMKKQAVVRQKAEQKHAAAEAKRNQQAANTTKQAEYFRRTGHVPSSFSFWRWCPESMFHWTS